MDSQYVNMCLNAHISTHRHMFFQIITKLFFVHIFSFHKEKSPLKNKMGIHESFILSKTFLVHEED